MSEPLKLKLKLSPVTQGIEDEADDEQRQPLRKKKKMTKQKHLVTAIDEAGTDPVAAKSHAKRKNPRQRESKDDLGLDADGVPNQHPLDSSTELCHHCNLGKL